MEHTNALFTRMNHSHSGIARTSAEGTRVYNGTPALNAAEDARVLFTKKRVELWRSKFQSMFLKYRQLERLSVVCASETSDRILGSSTGYLQMLFYVEFFMRKGGHDFSFRKESALWRGIFQFEVHFIKHETWILINWLCHLYGKHFLRGSCVILYKSCEKLIAEAMNVI